MGYLKKLFHDCLAVSDLPSDHWGESRKPCFQFVDIWRALEVLVHVPIEPFCANRGSAPISQTIQMFYSASEVCFLHTLLSLQILPMLVHISHFPLGVAFIPHGSDNYTEPRGTMILMGLGDVVPVEVGQLIGLPLNREPTKQNLIPSNVLLAVQQGMKRRIIVVSGELGASVPMIQAIHQDFDQRLIRP